MSIKSFKTKYKYGIGNKILSPDVGGRCTVHKVWVLQTFQFILLIILLKPNSIHVIISIL